MQVVFLIDCLILEFRVILRSSALECPDIGHCGAVLEFFRLGVHEFSRRNNCVLRYIRCVLYLNLCKKYTLIVSIDVVQLLSFS